MSSQSLILLGISLALAASVLQNLGMGFQKLGFERLKPLSSRDPLLDRIFRAKVWILGTAMTFFSWGFFLAALGYIGISIVQPILIGGLIFLVAFAIIFLKEQILPKEGVGIAICALGTLFVTLEAEKIKRDPDTWDTFVLFGFMCLMLILALAVMLHSQLILRKHPLAAGGAVSGIFTGLGAMFARSLTLEETNPINFIFSVHFWLLILFQASSFAVLQGAFHRERAVTVVPLYGGFAVLVPVIAGILVFGEKMGWFLLTGVIFVIIGIYLLSRIGAEVLGPEKLDFQNEKAF
ncbi:MAG: hypothetical protein ACXAEI_10530 [Candidatus Hodarchaeales archaeon]